MRKVLTLPDDAGIMVSLVNAETDTMFSEWREDVDDATRFLASHATDEDAETVTFTAGDLYRELQREYGRCDGKVYEDGADGPRHIGWHFTSRQHYEDSPQRYTRHAWVTLDAPRDRL